MHDNIRSPSRRDEEVACAPLDSFSLAKVDKRKAPGKPSMTIELSHAVLHKFPASADRRFCKNR